MGNVIPDPTDKHIVVIGGLRDRRRVTAILVLIKDLDARCARRIRLPVPARPLR